MNQRSDLVLRFLGEANPDVILLMEVNRRWMDALQPLQSTHPNMVERPREDNFGIALFSRLLLTNGAVLDLGEADLPSIVADLHVDGVYVHLLGTHPLPPGTREYARLRNDQLECIAEHACSQQPPVIVVGDLNTTPWSPYFRALVRDSGLRNTSQGRGVFASWPAWLPPMRVPLDHCLISPSMQVADKQLGPRVGGDHLPVVIDLILLPDADEATGPDDVARQEAGVRSK